MEARGPVWFILVYGVLGWGLTTGVLFAWVLSWEEGRSFLGALPLTLVFFPLGGLLWGFLMWRWLRATWARQDREDRAREPGPSRDPSGGEGPSADA